jgi:alpha-galactosidase
LSASPPEVIAVRLRRPADLNHFPVEQEWQRAASVSFCHDWQGRNEDPERSTEVQVLWSHDRIDLRFRCRYRSLNVFSDADVNGRRDQLWDRDVAEVFLQADRFGENYYKEYEISPNGQWLDLDIMPQRLRPNNSGMRSRVSIDPSSKIWTADLAIPIASVTPSFDPAQGWRVNFFRCEGLDPKRFYSAWQPTKTETPNFHVPQKFGTLLFGS